MSANNIGVRASFPNVTVLAKLHTIFATLIFSVALVAVGGCEKAPAPTFHLNEVEILKQEKASLANGEHFDDSHDDEIRNILSSLFGTPDQPRFPFLQGDEDPAHEFIDFENLEWAAGRVHSDQDGKPISGLYREHCAQCHGITGDGAGATAAFLNPYPRDFRLSKFKFKSTPLRRSPTDHDLELVLRNGIPGTAMPSFRTLPDEEIQALIDYVKYLTIRGQMERMLISELSSTEGKPLLDMSHAEDGDLVAALAKIESTDASTDRDDDVAESDESRSAFEEQLDYLLNELYFEGPLKRWSNTEDAVTEVPPVPESIRTTHPDHSQLVELGRELFYAKGNCAQCHGDTAMGDGQQTSYDDWTNDWIKSAGVDPTDKSTYQDFLDAGALRPRAIRPRNLRLPVYRGGGRPEDLYLRIKNGIEGTPMPAAATLSDQEIWAMVAYVKSLPFEQVVPQETK
ncbi:cytochrome c [Mariniblastus fucicola]|nr:cytochrome c [Mariniblastus fucicola]